MHQTQQTLKFDSLIDNEESLRKETQQFEPKEKVDARLNSLLPPTLSRSKYK